MMSIEETHMIVKEELPARPKLKGICKRLTALTAAALCLCVLIRGVSEFARQIADSDSDSYDDFWGCPRGRITSFDNQLWCANLDLTNAAYSTELIQGILKDKRAASADEKFRVQKAHWLMKISHIYRNLCKQANCNQQINDLLLHASQSYASSANEQTHYRTQPPTSPDKTTRAYVKYLKTVSTTHPAQYNAIAIVAHLRLWFELTNRLNNDGVVLDWDGHNGWILDLDQLERVLHEAVLLLDAAAYEFDWKAANDIYRHVMDYHIDAFEKATA